MGFVKNLHHCFALTGGILMAVPCFANPILPLGNGLVRQHALEKMIRATLAESLEAQAIRNSLRFRLPSLKETVALPEETGTLKQVLGLLGLKKSLSVGISPIQALFTLPESGLSVNVKETRTNFFAITAKWSLTELKAESETLSIAVPKGVFDRAFSINSSPVQIALKKGTPPIQFMVNLTADLNADGAKFKLQSIKTNLDSAHRPELSLSLGKLTVEKQPLELQIQSDGQTLTATEPTIRAEFQKLEPAFADVIRLRLLTLIKTQIMEGARALESQPSFKFDVSTDEFFAHSSLTGAMKNLLGGINFSVVTSYLQTLKSVDLNSIQAATEVCLDGKCIENTVPTSSINSEDLKSIKTTDEVSVILYESFLQNFVESSAFQKRFANYYATAGASPGVELAPSGVKIYLDPSQNSILTILNLEVDIKKTAAKGSPFGLRLRRRIGDLLETLFGSGKVVKIPIAINLKIKGLQKDSNGDTSLVLMPELNSFGPDHTFIPSPKCSASLCPDNVSSMTRFVKGEFLDTVKEEVTQAVGTAGIKIPLTDVNFKGLTFKTTNVVVTPNHGILVTTSMNTGIAGEK